MKDIKVIAMIFMIFAMTAVLFISCEDKDSQSNEPANEELVCDPVCGENQECKCVESEDKSECKCEDKQAVECKCEDGTVCPENDKTKCVVAPVEDNKCNPVCSENQECKCVESECKCEDKHTEHVSPDVPKPEEKA